MGSSFTGILAALSADPAKLRETLQIALCETLCNVTGTLFFYPIPFLRQIPMKVAMTLGDLTARYRWFALVYLVLFFFVLPFSLLSLTLLPLWAMITTLTLIILFFVTIYFINWAQSNYTSILPNFLKSWDFLPTFLHSLEPYDQFIRQNFGSIACCRSHFVSEERKQSHKNSVMKEMAPTMTNEEQKRAVQAEEDRIGFIRDILRTPSPSYGGHY